MPTTVNSTTFQLGDAVIHTAKPDWGTGNVLSAKPDTEQGGGAQKLQVRFQHAGMKTLSTAFATLQAVSGGGAPAGPDLTTSAAATAPKLDPDQDPAEAMATLPAAATDPFVTPLQRLEATLALYRFTIDGGGLIEWATLQSGLADPLSRFSRHDLEEYFRRFAHYREQHLGKVRKENLSGDPKALGPVVASAPPEAREALRRLTRRS